jgi:hypothetical protein
MLSEKDIEDLRLANGGEIEHCKGKDDAWEVVLKKMPRKVYKVFRAHCNNPAMKAEAQEFALRAMVVHPPLAALDALLESFPGIAESGAVSNAIMKLCGMQSDETGKA